ncbi:MAG: hypothetical protein INR65_17970 [Gluconacetobacter diazotrophicus]|nr:hypothetical protein [Gluconacetobacter diazotrophicus]
MMTGHGMRRRLMGALAASWIATGGGAAAAAECRFPRGEVLIGGNNSVSDLATPGNLSHVLPGGRLGLYASVFAINNMVAEGDAFGGKGSDARGRAIMRAFAKAPPAIGEEFYDSHGTPGLPAAARNDGKALDKVDGPAAAAAIGWRPEAMMLNINYTGGKEHFLRDGDVAQFRQAAAELKQRYPSVRCVWPYINGQDPNWNGNNPYWALAKTMIREAGGVGIDIPVGLPLASFASPNYLLATANEIRWANANGVQTVLLLTPWAAKAPPGIMGQFAHDDQFLRNTQRIVGYLEKAGAVPSVYVVSNYSGTLGTGARMITANRIGSDTDAATPSVAFVARWVLEHSGR